MVCSLKNARIFYIHPPPPFFLPGKKTKPHLSAGALAKEKVFISPREAQLLSKAAQAFLHIFTFPSRLAGEDASCGRWRRRSLRSLVKIAGFGSYFCTDLKNHDFSFLNPCDWAHYKDSPRFSFRWAKNVVGTDGSQTGSQVRLFIGQCNPVSGFCKALLEMLVESSVQIHEIESQKEIWKLDFGFNVSNFISERLAQEQKSP